MFNEWCGPFVAASVKASNDLSSAGQSGKLVPFGSMTLTCSPFNTATFAYFPKPSTRRCLTTSNPGSTSSSTKQKLGIVLEDVEPGFCFVLEDVEPGLLVVKHRRLDGFGKYANVAVLKGEQVKMIDEKGTSLPDCPSLLRSLLAFTAAATNGPHNSLNVLVQLAASMRAQGHGGSLLVVPTGDDRWRKSIAQPILYSIRPSFSALSELARHEVDVNHEDRRQWESAMRRAVDTIGGLTAVDGATVINDRYEVLAFGAKIRRPEGSPPVDKWVITEPVVGNVGIVVQPTEHGGTRHLSAAQFVFDQHETLALVASQDGRFTVFAWSQCEEMVHAHRVESLLM